MSKPHFIVRLNWVDFVTIAGLVLACIAIYHAVCNKLELALGWLFLAVLADAFDGVLARKFGTERDFGRYLDSFVDCSIYLAAPSVILIQLGYSSFFALSMLLIFIISGIVRLSVFNEIGNVKDSGNLSYLGLPVFWSVFLLAAYFGFFTLNASYSMISKTVLHTGLSVLLLLYAYLMQKNTSFYKPKNKIMMVMVVLSLSAYYFYLGYSN